MGVNTLCELYGICLERDGDDDVKVGDIVSAGPNKFPRYRVLATVEDKVWLREMQHGTDHVVPTCRCRVVPGLPLQSA